MKQLTISFLSKILGAEYDAIKLKDRAVKKVITQSVYTKSGDAVIAARWYNARNTVDEALEKGASVVFCEKKLASQYVDNRVVSISNGLECVEKFEKFCEWGCNAKRITITGSVGKTTTTGLINSIISNKYNALTHHSMSNSHGAILRNFQKLTPEHEYWIQEVGGVQPRYIESSAYILHSDAVVLTNIGTSHLDQYKTKQEIFKDKSSLERYAKFDGVVIVNYDDEILREASYTHETISYGIQNKNVDYYAENIRITEKGTCFDMVCNEGVYKIELKLFGKYNVYNALAAIAVGRWAGVSFEDIINLMKTYYPSGMRQNMMNIGGYSMLVDCFNAEPKTVLGSAETLSQIKRTTGKKVFITGHIDKLGEKSSQLHYELGEQLASLDIDEMVFFAGDSRYTYESVIAHGYKNAHLMKSREELDEWIRGNVGKDDLTFYKSGQFEAALAKSIDHVYGTNFQNEQQYNNGILKSFDDFIFNIRKDDIIEVYEYQGKEPRVKIPHICDGVDVIRVGTGAFWRNSRLEEIQMPNSIVHIGKEAFYICTKLRLVSLPLGLKYIGRSAFNFCKSLSSIVLPKGVIHIDTRAFRDCVSLESIVIPDTVGFIGEEAFYHCPKLTIICKPNSIAHQYAIDNNILFELKNELQIEKYFKEKRI